MEGFANALRQLPSIIAENGGYDSAQLVSELRALHATGKNTMGLNMYEVSYLRINHRLMHKCVLNIEKFYLKK